MFYPMQNLGATLCRGSNEKLISDYFCETFISITMFSFIYFLILCKCLCCVRFGEVCSLIIFHLLYQLSKQVTPVNECIKRSNFGFVSWFIPWRPAKVEAKLLSKIHITLCFSMNECWILVFLFFACLKISMFLDRNTCLISLSISWNNTNWITFFGNMFIWGFFFRKDEKKMRRLLLCAFRLTKPSPSKVH